jgi:hypothetical protein
LASQAATIPKIYQNPDRVADNDDCRRNPPEFWNGQNEDNEYHDPGHIRISLIDFC